jgi:hypothetical protein
MIYPNPAKDVETTQYPYAELFRDFAAAVCRPNAVAVTYGYGFGDDHVNRVLLDMLTIPSDGISCRQGTHQVAQKFSRTARSLTSARLRARPSPPSKKAKGGTDFGGMIDMMPTARSERVSCDMLGALEWDSPAVVDAIRQSLAPTERAQ